VGDCDIGAYERMAVCGNATIEAGEDCDDGNIVAGDGCSDICELEPPLARDRLKCQRGINAAGAQFWKTEVAARKTCLEKQLKGKLSLTVECRGTPTGDSQTDKKLTDAESELHTSLIRKCTGIILEGLGFPGLCEDPEGPPFEVDELEECVGDTLHEGALQALDVLSPLP